MFATALKLAHIPLPLMNPHFLDLPSLVTTVASSGSFCSALIYNIKAYFHNIHCIQNNIFRLLSLFQCLSSVYIWDFSLCSISLYVIAYFIFQLYSGGNFISSCQKTSHDSSHQTWLPSVFVLVNDTAIQFHILEIIFDIALTITQHIIKISGIFLPHKCLFRVFIFLIHYCDIFSPKCSHLLSRPLDTYLLL